jgi:hypothetical protein
MDGDHGSVDKGLRGRTTITPSCNYLTVYIYSSLLSRSFVTVLSFLSASYCRCISFFIQTTKRTRNQNNNKTMGDRHNRKRTRHRPIRRQRLCPQFDQCEAMMIPSPSPSDHQLPTPLACSCWHFSVRQTPTSTTTSTTSNTNMRLQTLQPSHCATNPPSTIDSIPETPRSRTRRVFGGVDLSDDDGSDDEESTELCGPMLDVVLGLFGGVDYDYDDDHLR